ncbi:vWA domain-containing protein [Sphingomonas sp. CJ99]
MFLGFIDALRAAGIQASLTEHLLLLEALDREVIDRTPDAFYHLARAVFVKDETMIDRFDQVFASVFRGALGPAALPEGDIPAEWLRAVAERYLSSEELAELKAIGDWDTIMATLKQRLAEQRERHEGGSKWIGTGGTSPYGNSGHNPAGVRIGGEGKRGHAIKVWEAREFRNLDNSRELGTRSLKIALRRLRRFAREGAANELDLDATISGTARQGWLDVRMRPERHNAVKLLLMLDVGGSMDPHVRLVEELFSAATAEFKHLQFFYFHNCPYEGLWLDNRRRHHERIATREILNKYGPDHKLILVGDAAMSPYELTHTGGSVEHFNEESGLLWLSRLTDTWRSSVWINPVAEALWGYSQSTRIIADAMKGRMYPLTLAGLDDAMRELVRRR